MPERIYYSTTIEKLNNTEAMSNILAQILVTCIETRKDIKKISVAKIRQLINKEGFQLTQLFVSKQLSLKFKFAFHRKRVKKNGPPVVCLKINNKIYQAVYIYCSNEKLKEKMFQHFADKLKHIWYLIPNANNLIGEEEYDNTYNGASILQNKW